ncbi:protein SLX4IP isoform X1 [Dicentrarchus labrax]|uniref:SLX4 interacting protein n=1 Tax=Dicentrarchus labrax TaxID=13489 RepID=A0A8P4GA97_DICLA|nr:protein SLX4IP isoform X1 [Dicentrarchus labrax]XP_051231217.1 protein SLX4IP isoform X1 [Dicentrarchus labrax]XP_051231224.1 protein SLX4IP isoform X1 [Dicentrarchus labrax]XP_051231227.1 protein SLX4IP isoform X1 [Dicentrarchus labrax]XP_051231236.1 protein SLX4IP isoform X1 [Dicentrarchus labrax]
MAPIKFVIKCGNFAVLVDLHVLPLGSQEDASWFTTDHIEEVTALVRDAVDQRVKQYTESLHVKRQPKQKKELAPASAFFVKGKSFNLVANFLKRHVNLRCIAKKLYGDLRVFPERYVVCVSCPEDASAHHGNPSLAATELNEQSRSEYFSRAGETQEPLNSLTKTKKTVLQKIAKQARVQRDRYGSSTGELRIDQRACLKNQTRGLTAGESESSPISTSSGQKAFPEADHKVHFTNASNEAVVQIVTTRKQGLTLEQQTESSPPDSIHPNGASVVLCQHEISQEEHSKSKRCKSSDVGEDPHPQRAKRTCLGRPPATTQTHSTECSTQTSKHDLLPLPPLPPVEAKAESKAFPVSECKKTTLEVELLTLGKRAQRLPLTSNNTAQTNQNRLAASLRGLSVKPASSGSSISSRSTLEEEGSENVPRTSRLRRLKRS